MKVRKSLGQHFLKSERALRTIIEAGEVASSDTVLEIGPGTGTLTERLLGTGARVVAVEKDANLYEYLKEKFEKEISSSRLKLVHDDILNFEPKSYNLEAGSYKLVANIPYNITGAILKKFLGADCQPERMVLLVQKEVAERIVAKPRSAPTSLKLRRASKATRGKESILSISVKAYGKPHYVETVKAGSFAPMPKVDSAIIAIENISNDFFNCGRSASTVCEGFLEQDFFKMLRAGFKSKRKKLSSNLSGLYGQDKVRGTFHTLKLDENTRAEDVGIDTWRKLALELNS